VLADVSGVDIEVKESSSKDSDSEQASWWDRLFGQVPKTEETQLSIKPTGTVEQDMSLRDLHQKLEELNQKLDIIASNSNNMSQYVDELRTNSSSIKIGM